MSDNQLNPVVLRRSMFVTHADMDAAANAVRKAGYPVRIDPPAKMKTTKDFSFEVVKLQNGCAFAKAIK